MSFKDGVTASASSAQSPSNGRSGATPLRPMSSLQHSASLPGAKVVNQPNAVAKLRSRLNWAPPSQVSKPPVRRKRRLPSPDKDQEDEDEGEEGDEDEGRAEKEDEEEEEDDDDAEGEDEDKDEDDEVWTKAGSSTAVASASRGSQKRMKSDDRFWGAWQDVIHKSAPKASPTLNTLMTQHPLEMLYAIRLKELEARAVKDAQDHELALKRLKIQEKRLEIEEKRLAIGMAQGAAKTQTQATLKAGKERPRVGEEKASARFETRLEIILAGTSSAT
ncbi:unnamed protein product [Mortierella alpina]